MQTPSQLYHNNNLDNMEPTTNFTEEEADQLRAELTVCAVDAARARAANGDAAARKPPLKTITPPPTPPKHTGCQAHDRRLEIAAGGRASRSAPLA